MIRLTLLMLLVAAFLLTDPVAHVVYWVQLAQFHLENPNYRTPY